MGPVVTTLATIGPGIVGAAWTAVGTLVLAFARGRFTIMLGVLALAVGVATYPLIAVPLVLGIGVLRDIAASTWTPPRHAAPRPRDAGHRHRRPDTGSGSLRWWLGLTLLGLPIGVLGVLLALSQVGVPLDGPDRAALLLASIVVVVAGLAVSQPRAPAVAAGSVLLLAGLPWAGAGDALPVAVATVSLVGVLLINAWCSRPVEQRPHPLLRATVAIPVLVFAVVGALFLPPTVPVLPHAELAAWITGPSSEGGTVAVPASLWGDLVRDGVPPERLVRGGSGDTADWTVGTGQSTPGATEVARFGQEPALMVSKPAPDLPSAG
jgi:putative peptide zinc metalloprotease protein